MRIACCVPCCGRYVVFVNVEPMENRSQDKLDKESKTFSGGIKTLCCVRDPGADLRLIFIVGTGSWLDGFCGDARPRMTHLF